MPKQPSPTLHKSTRTEITPLFGEARLVPDETPKVISPFGGLASFISFLGQIGFARQVQTRPSQTRLHEPHQPSAWRLQRCSGGTKAGQCARKAGQACPQIPPQERRFRLEKILPKWIA